jgi:hypothetical protein
MGNCGDCVAGAELGLLGCGAITNDGYSAGCGVSIFMLEGQEQKIETARVLALYTFCSATANPLIVCNLVRVV